MTSSTPEAPPLYTPRAKNFALLLLAMTQFVIVIDAAIVNVALPSIGGQLHFARTDLSWVVNAYTLTFGGFLLLGGRLADLLGRRRMFMLGLVLFSVASFAGGIAQSEGWLIVARAVQGLGAAIVSPAALSIVTTTFAEGAERNRALGIWGAVAGAGAFVLDVKREYGPLCDAVGVKPVSLEPGGSIRLNPLASRPEEHAQLELLRAVTVTAVGGPLTQVEAGGLREALHTVRAGGTAEPTLPQIAKRLFDPTGDMAERLRTTTERLALDVRRAALALQDLCEGPLKGMFDGPTTPGLDLDAKLLVLDLHAVKDSPAVGILMACATAWMSALLARMAERPGRERLINVADESWKIVQHTGLGEWFQSNFKLARQFGVMNLVVLHKLADLSAAGDAGSRAARIAEGLVADASTRIVYHQDESQVPLTRSLLGLSENEARLISMLSAGQALWRVGSRSFVVQHYRSQLETRLTNTDTGMRVNPDGFEASQRRTAGTRW